MRNTFFADEWKIAVDRFDPERKRLTESIFSQGNGHMGLRGFFEESYTGDSLQGTYLAGVYYPDRTKVGWWKNGFTESFAKVVNSVNWIGVGIRIDGEELDLARVPVSGFHMELDMRTGLLERSFEAAFPQGKHTRFCFSRFLSMENRNLACISVRAVPLDYSGEIEFLPYLDGDVVNEDSNYGEKFWTEIEHGADAAAAWLSVETLKTGFRECAAMRAELLPAAARAEAKDIVREKFAARRIRARAEQGSELTLRKFVAVCTSRDFARETLAETARGKLAEACALGWEELFTRHCRVLARRWEQCDVVIEGDVAAQQGIRYNIFQLNQTYTGEDPRLNLGPKGFSGEKYGGSTYWDTEAFCLPFYLYTDAAVARQLLYYRYLHLEKARGNAARLGLAGALYPMVTMDGDECHNEWEITFEELHRNGAIAYAIYNYTNYTGDFSYIDRYGIEELIEISRFYASRVNWQPRKGCYMMLGVTGPNEYENNVNNNWYTNTLAAWCMEYTLAQLTDLGHRSPERRAEVLRKLRVDGAELERWRDISEKMYRPAVAELGIFEQQDGYMDKEQRLARDIPAAELPLNKHWSWDRILRSCFIKQADVIQAFYFFPDSYDLACKRRNFDFYEPRTVHESSLSPSVYSIVASHIGYRQKAYELYLRTARLDLDDYNDDTEDGVHLTSMAGSWLAIVEGFAGALVSNGRLRMNPYIPEQWKRYRFRMNFHGRDISVDVTPGQLTVELLRGEPLELTVFGSARRLEGTLRVDMREGSGMPAPEK